MTPLRPLVIPAAALVLAAAAQSATRATAQAGLDRPTPSAPLAASSRTPPRLAIRRLGRHPCPSPRGDLPRSRDPPRHGRRCVSRRLRPGDSAADPSAPAAHHETRPSRREGGPAIPSAVPALLPDGPPGGAGRPVHLPVASRPAPVQNPPHGATDRDKLAGGSDARPPPSRCVARRSVARYANMCSPMYVELHAHSAFSFLDGASLPDELAPPRPSSATRRWRSPTTTASRARWSSPRPPRRSG